MNYIILLIMGLSWGLHFVLAKMAAVTCSPCFLMFPMFAGISAVFLISLKLRKEKIVIDFSVIKFFIISGLLGYLFPILMELIVAPKIDAGLLTLIVTTAPLITIFCAGISKTEKVYASQILAALLELIGILILFLPSTLIPSSNMGAWALLAFLVPTIYAIYNVYVAKFWPAKLNTLQVAAGESIVATLIAFPLFLFDLSREHIANAYAHKELLLALILVTTLEVWAFFELIKRAGPIYVSFSSFITLLSGYFWGWVLLDEQITKNTGLSGIFLLLSFLALNFRYYKEKMSFSKNNHSDKNNQLKILSNGLHD